MIAESACDDFLIGSYALEQSAILITRDRGFVESAAAI